jgi:hypothetical protein
MRFRQSISVIALFVLLTGVVMSPLVFHLNSRVPSAPTELGHGQDYYHFQWDLWWLRYAVLHGENIWYTNKVLAPFTHNLTYHSLTASMLPFYLVLEPLIGHLRSANAIIWISLALTGSLMYGLLRYHRISRLGALLGGIALALSPYMLDHAGGGHLNLITAWWIPMVLYTWDRLVATHRFRWAILTGIVMWGMWFTDTLIIFWGGLLLSPCALYALGVAENRRERLRLVRFGAAILVIAVVLAWCLGPLKQTLDFDTGQLPPARLLTLRYYSLSAQSLFVPGLGGDQIVGIEHDETLGLLVVVLTWIALILGVWRVYRRRQVRIDETWFWLLAALPALILALGPDVRIAGVRVPLPFRVVHKLFGGQMRTPIRFLPPATAALVLFLAHRYDPVLRRARTRGLVASVCLLALLLDYGALSRFPTIPALPSYHFYTMMRSEHYQDYDYVVLEVPSGPFTGWREIGSHPEAMYYGITHQKRMVSGLLSRIPIDEHLFYEQSALLGWLTDSRPLDASRAAIDLKHYVAEWPIGYVVVHQDWMSMDKTLEVLAFFNSQPSLCFVEVERDAVLYRAATHPKGCPPRLPPSTGPGSYLIRLGERGDEGFIGSGWYGSENIGGEIARWAGGQNEALLYASLPAGSGYAVTFRAVAFEQPRRVKVVVGTVVNGEQVVQRLGYFISQPGEWSEYTLILPADLVGGDLTFSLAADGLVSAADLGLSDDSRPLTLAYDTVEFRAIAP